MRLWITNPKPLAVFRLQQVVHGCAVNSITNAGTGNKAVKAALRLKIATSSDRQILLPRIHSHRRDRLNNV